MAGVVILVLSLSFRPPPLNPLGEISLGLHGKVDRQQPRTRPLASTFFCAIPAVRAPVTEPLGKGPDASGGSDSAPKKACYLAHNGKFISTNNAFALLVGINWHAVKKCVKFARI